MKLFETYFLWLVIYSVLGWIYETIICSIEQRHFVKRGFLNGPYCPIYGFGAVFIIGLLGGIENILLLFLIGMVLTCSLEYLTSWGMEALFHARWWDYSDKKFNIKGRVCLLGAVVFGTFSVLLIKFIHPFISSYTQLISDPLLHILFYALLVLLLADSVYTVRSVLAFDQKLKEISQELSITIGNARNTALEYKNEIVNKIETSAFYSKVNETYDTFVKKLNNQERRMIHTFPSLKSIQYNDTLQKLKEWMSEKRNMQK